MRYRPDHIGTAYSSTLFERKDYSNQLLTKEWLVRIDSSSSAPYLFVSISWNKCFPYNDLILFHIQKFCVLPGDNSCCLMITDTKTVWTEGLSNRLRSLLPKHDSLS